MSSNDVLRRVIEEAFAAQDRVDAARIVESADLAEISAPNSGNISAKS